MPFEHTLGRLLPHTLEQGGVASVELKKRLCYKSSESSRVININHLYEGLRLLRDTNHHYKVTFQSGLHFMNRVAYFQQLLSNCVAGHRAEES